jgi:hypothetical protein
MSFENSKRIQAFRRELIAAVPRFPNDATSIQTMQAKPLVEQMIVYISWRLRFVGHRPRRVTGRSNLVGDHRFSTLQPNIDAFLQEVEAGSDLTPYLSLEPRTRGYTPAAEAKADRWADKDFLLNIMGLHHFHLGLTREPAGHVSRTNDVMFASVTRDEFEIIGLFDHAVFEHLDDGTMTPEREKLWRVYEAQESTRALPGQLRVGGYANFGVTLSGHPVAVVRAAQNHVRIVRDRDPKLDDPTYLKTLYPDGKIPKNTKIKWTYTHLDLGITDGRESFFGIFHKGPN